MPSFDVVSEINHHELHNGVDQANREVTTRFDFKGTGSNFELAGLVITMHTESEFQLQQMYDILCNKLVKRGIDIACLAKDMVKLIKQSKLKVQAAIQGDQLRITGKKRDDLQEAIALLKDAAFDTPLQYKNFRD